MKKTTDKKAEYQAGAALVGEGITFEIDGIFYGKRPITIKPCLPGTNIRISMKILQLQDVDHENPTVHEFFKKASNINIIAGIIATAAINSDVFKMWKYRLLKWLFLFRVKDMEHLYYYWLIVQRQMGPLFFYRIMESTPAMNFLEAKETEDNLKEARPSGERSDSSKKHSTSAATMN